MDAALHPHSPEALVAAQSLASVRANVVRIQSPVKINRLYDADPSRADSSL